MILFVLTVHILTTVDDVYRDGARAVELGVFCQNGEKPSVCIRTVNVSPVSAWNNLLSWLVQCDG